MTKSITAILLALSATPVLAQTSYQQIGNTTFFSSDGTSYQRIGNTTLDSDGSSYQNIGNNTFGSDGSSAQRIGNSTFIQDGRGNSRTCQPIGSSTFCN